MDPRTRQLVQKVSLLYKQQKFEEALEEAEMLIMSQSTLLEAYLLAGICCKELGRKHQAEKHYKIALDFAPTNMQVTNALISLYTEWEEKSIEALPFLISRKKLLIKEKSTPDKILENYKKIFGVLSKVSVSNNVYIDQEISELVSNPIKHPDYIPTLISALAQNPNEALIEKYLTGEHSEKIYSLLQGVDDPSSIDQFVFLVKEKYFSVPAENKKKWIGKIKQVAEHSSHFLLMEIADCVLLVDFQDTQAVCLLAAKSMAFLGVLMGTPDLNKLEKHLKPQFIQSMKSYAENSKESAEKAKRTLYNGIRYIEWLMGRHFLANAIQGWKDLKQRAFFGLRDQEIPKEVPLEETRSESLLRTFLRLQNQLVSNSGKLEDGSLLNAREIIRIIEKGDEMAGKSAKQVFLRFLVRSDLSSSALVKLYQEHCEEITKDISSYSSGGVKNFIDLSLRVQETGSKAFTLKLLTASLEKYLKEVKNNQKVNALWRHFTQNSSAFGDSLVEKDDILHLQMLHELKKKENQESSLKFKTLLRNFSDETSLNSMPAFKISQRTCLLRSAVAISFSESRWTSVVSISKCILNFYSEDQLASKMTLIALLKLNQHQEAFEFASKLPVSFQRISWLRLFLGISCYSMGQYTSALDHLQCAIDLMKSHQHQDNIGAKSLYPGLHFGLEYPETFVRVSSGLIGNVSPLYEPQESNFTDITSQAYFILAQVNRQLGRLETAVNCISSSYFKGTQPVEPRKEPRDQLMSLEIEKKTIVECCLALGNIQLGQIDKNIGLRSQLEVQGTLERALLEGGKHEFISSFKSIANVGLYADHSILKSVFLMTVSNFIEFQIRNFGKESLTGKALSLLKVVKTAKEPVFSFEAWREAHLGFVVASLIPSERGAMIHFIETKLNLLMSHHFQPKQRKTISGKWLQSFIEKPEETKREFSASVLSDSRHVFVILAMLALLKDEKDFSEKVYNALHVIYPTWGETFLFGALLLSSSRPVHSRLAMLMFSIHLGPADPIKYNLLASSLLQEANYLFALKAVSGSLQSNTSNSIAYFILGSISLKVFLKNNLDYLKEPIPKGLIQETAKHELLQRFISFSNQAQEFGAFFSMNIFQRISLIFQGKEQRRFKWDPSLIPEWANVKNTMELFLKAFYDLDFLFKEGSALSRKGDHEGVVSLLNKEFWEFNSGPHRDALLLNFDLLLSCNPHIKILLQSLLVIYIDSSSTLKKQQHPFIECFLDSLSLDSDEFIYNSLLEFFNLDHEYTKPQAKSRIVSSMLKGNIQECVRELRIRLLSSPEDNKMQSLLRVLGNLDLCRERDWIFVRIGQEWRSPDSKKRDSFLNILSFPSCFPREFIGEMLFSIETLKKSKESQKKKEGNPATVIKSLQLRLFECEDDQGALMLQILDQKKQFSQKERLHTELMKKLGIAVSKAKIKGNCVESEEKELEEIDRQLAKETQIQNKVAALHARRIQLLIKLKQNKQSIPNKDLISEIYEEGMMLKRLGESGNKLTLIPYAEYLYMDERFEELEEVLTDLGYLNLPESVEPFVNYFVLVLKLRQLDKEGDNEEGELKELCLAIIEFLEEKGFAAEQLPKLKEILERISSQNV